MSSNGNRKLLRGIMVLASFILCFTILIKCEMVTYAYTDEEKEAAKQWLIQYGYSPDRGGANQAYQDYLNGKFDGEDLKGEGNQDDSQAPGNQQNPDENQAPGTSQGIDETPNQGAADSGVSTDGDEESSVQGDSEEDEDSEDEKDSKNKNDKNKNDKNKNDKNKQDKNKDATKEDGVLPGDGEQPQVGTGLPDAEQNTVDDVVGDVLDGEMTAEQEADFMMFIATQVVNEGKKPIDEEERAKYQAELYEKSLVNTDLVSGNDVDDDHVGENKTGTTLEETPKSTLYNWIIISVLALCVLGGVSIFIIKKR